ncbi:complement C1q-like protein 4 [Sardina pilchardus]|uniref:complement C1q-like protein 4 n=1 Tax=Sardina pilchardus TaxID=27697 RepID=UPI002E111E08
MVVEQRVQLTVTQNELLNTQTLLYTMEDENDALHTEMAVLKTRLAAMKTRLASTETEVVNLKKEITDQPKVAFSVGLGISGYIASGSTEQNLVFTKIFSNVGQAYSSVTGFFTAPVKGVYYFRFNVMDNSPSRYMHIIMYKNGERLMLIGEGPQGYPNYVSSGMTLQLEVGDVVNLRLYPNNTLYDNSENHNIFSGFLLFTL